MPTRLSLPLCLCALFAACILSACGGGGSGPPAPPFTLPVVDLGTLSSTTPTRKVVSFENPLLEPADATVSVIPSPFALAGDGQVLQVGPGEKAEFDKRTGSWKKPFAVLLGPKTFSAGETEVWALRDMRDGRQCNTRFFGQTTAGASGAKIRWKLPSGVAEGRFVLRHWRGGRSTIEGSGIEPDEVVLQDVVELSLGIDSCIRRAEAWLREQ